jgi:transmembrane protein
VATLLARGFWTLSGPGRMRPTATFLERVAVIGGMAMATLFVNGRSAPR